MNKLSTQSERILYFENGNEVTITDSGLTVKKTHYQLNGISGHGLSIVAPVRVPYIVLMTLAAIIFFCGAFSILPSIFAMAIGAVLFAAAFVVVMTKKEKYAVKIITAEGEKNVVVSPSREYITHIVAALNRAFLDLTTKQNKK